MNARIYSLLLRLYPTELREDFGAEMMQVFLDDMEAGHAARVWWRSLEELCTIALPVAARRSELKLPLFLYAVQAFYFYCVLAHHRGLAVFLVPVLTTFIVLKVNDSEVPDPSPLARR